MNGSSPSKIARTEIFLNGGGGGSTADISNSDEKRGLTLKSPRPDDALCSSDNNLNKAPSPSKSNESLLTTLNPVQLSSNPALLPDRSDCSTTSKLISYLRPNIATLLIYEINYSEIRLRSRYL